MLNPVTKPDTASGDQAMPRLDLQQHLQDLDRAGLLVRIDRPINKDTQLHPLVRWQFLGGIPADDRRAFLFTNVIDAKGRKYDMPVVVGAFSASARIYALGMGQKVEDIGNAWLKAIQNPIPPVRVEHAACQEVVVTGAALREKGGGVAALPVPISTPGFDAAPYLTATLCVTRDPETGVQNMGTYRAGLKATDRMAVRMVARPGGAGGYIHWLKYRERKEPMEIAIVIGAAPIVEFTGPQKLAIDVDEMAVAGGLAGRPIPMARCVSVDLDVPADSEIVIEGVIDTSILEPEAPFGESNGYVALEAFNMPMRVTAITRRKNAVFASIISQVTPSESSTIKIVASIRQHTACEIELEVVPGVSSLALLAARHAITLNQVGRPVHITTGRRLPSEYRPELGDVAVMLDGSLHCKEILREHPDLIIYWGAQLGLPDEVLIAGRLADVIEEIEAARAAARTARGWVMDIYLLRDPASDTRAPAR